MTALSPYVQRVNSVLQDSPAQKIPFRKVDESTDLSDQNQSRDKQTSVSEGSQVEAKANDDLQTIQQQQEIESVVLQLKARDTEVRAHEMSHVVAGGQWVTSGPSYQYQVGPDGKQYAVGGEVGISVSPVDGDPEATIQKAQQVQRAALAPAEPSSQDYRVASAAMQMMVQAQQELKTQNLEDSVAFSEQESDSTSQNQPLSLIESDGNQQIKMRASDEMDFSRTQFQVRLGMQ